VAPCVVRRFSIFNFQFSIRDRVHRRKSHKMSRVACYLVPMFCLAARLRSEPELRETALVITAGNGSAAHVVAATRRARKQGITPGMSLPQARAILPKLIARGRDLECERAAQDALLELGESFSPRIENAGEGVVYLDVTGMHIHFLDGIENDKLKIENENQADSSFSIFNSQFSIPAAEHNLALEAMRLGTAKGLPIRVGIAGSKLAARVAAELPHSPHIVASGDERAFLAPLPITRLSPQLEAAAMLERWGIASIGELATIPEGEVATRLGEIGRMLHYAARGIDARPIVPHQPPPVFEEGMELEWPVVQIEPFLFVASAALDRLAQRLEAQGYSCRTIEVTLRLEPEGFYHRSIELPAPTRDVKTMLTLFRLDLEANPPNGPVAAFTFVAHPDKPRRGQLSLFGPPAMSPDKVAATIAKIASIVGRDRIGSPRTVDGYLPERFAMAEFNPPAQPELRRQPQRNRGLLAVRVIRPAVEIEVVTAEETRPQSTVLSPQRESTSGSSFSIFNSQFSIPDEVPADPTNGIVLRPGDLGYEKPQQRVMDHDDSFSIFNFQFSIPTRIRALAPAHLEDDKQKFRQPLEIDGTVRVASGPWRLEDGWWTDHPIERDYWDLEVIGRGVYRVFRDRVSDRWFVDGVYD